VPVNVYVDTVGRCTRYSYLLHCAVSTKMCVITRIYILVDQIVVLSSVYILVRVPYSKLFVTYVIVLYTGLSTSLFDKANILKVSPGFVELYYIRRIGMR
jgi:hypothetical protein